MLLYFRATAECWGKSRDTSVEIRTGHHQNVTASPNCNFLHPPRFSTTLFCQGATDSNEITLAARDSPILMSLLILVVPACLRISIRSTVTCFNTFIYLQGSHPPPNPQTVRLPFASWRKLLNQHFLSYPLYLEAAFSIRNMRIYLCSVAQVRHLSQISQTSQ